jgi:hypothetical protein
MSFTVLASLALVVFLNTTTNQARVHADAASTGKAIGTGINAAITAAFPGVSSIINAIWPKGQDNTNKKKADATTATQQLQQKATQSLNQFDTVTTDLDTITLFLANCIVADDHIIAMRTMLKGKTALTPTDILALSNDWSIAKGRLTNLKGQGPAVTKMNDASVQVVLQAVVDSTSGLTDNVTDQIKAGTPAIDLLSTNLEELDHQLSAVNALSGQIIQNISSGLKNVKNTAAGAQGEVQESPALKQARKDFADAVKARYKIQ